MGDQAELNLLHMCCSPPRVCGTRGGDCGTRNCGLPSVVFAQTHCAQL